MEQKVAIGLVQMHSGEDTDHNLTNALEQVSRVAVQGAQIVCLPELFNAPYFCQEKDDRYFDLAEEVPGATTSLLGEAAKRHSIVVIASVYEKAEGKYYNTAIVVAPHGLIGKYRKMHIPDDPTNHYDEAYYFAPGDLGFQTFQTQFAQVAPMVCFDQWFPEGARIAAVNGAQILFYPTAIGWPVNQTREDLNRAENNMWKIVQISHGIANNCFVVAVNRVGLDNKLQFWGSSFVSDPYGRVLAEAPTNAEANLVVSCDLALIDQKRRDWPFLDVRRIKYEE
jgi:N-carbamoylputrescine amidase